jgi:hypothetical protein
VIGALSFQLSAFSFQLSAFSSQRSAKTLQRRLIAPLEALFASDVVSYSDGGGLVRVAGKSITGRERVARFISAVATQQDFGFG